MNMRRRLLAVCVAGIGLFGTGRALGQPQPQGQLQPQGQPQQIQPKVRGALDLQGMFDFEGRIGGALRSDLWFGPRSWGFGGTVAVGALSQTGSKSSRVFTPLGLSLTWLPPYDKSGFTAAGRGGVYAGALKGGWMFGPWVGGGVGYRSALGEGASLRYGLDVWKAFGDERGVLLAPFFGLGF